jgi:hypothetical protein
MPRGKALDTLPEAVAEKVKIAIGDARYVKGLTNAELAAHLGWDVRTVTDCLTLNRSLRLSKARKLVNAAYVLSPRRDGRRLTRAAAGPATLEAHVVLDPVSTELFNLEHDLPEPAVLIATSDYSKLVNLLQKKIAARLTLSAARERALKETLERTLREYGGAFALEAYWRCISRGKPMDPRKTRSRKIARVYRRTASRVLRRFGYECNF